MSGFARHSDTRLHTRAVTLPIFLALLMFLSALVLAPARASAQSTATTTTTARRSVSGGTSTFGPEVMVVRSCLGGNGRVDFNMVNVGANDATYRIEFQGLSPRQRLVAAGDWWRNPITGRPDGSYAVTVKRDGVVVLAETIAIGCDTAAKDITDTEFNVVNACSAGNGYLLFQFVNDRPERRDYVIVFESVPNRSVRAEAHAGVVRAVTGRPDGTYRAQIRVGSTFVYDEQIEVNCDGASPPPASATCQDLPVTINMNINGVSGTGTTGNDVILGTPGDDVINARGGNDVVCAGAGNDKIVGGEGNDSLLGGPGNDEIDGNGGADQVIGNEGDDRINTGSGNDKAWGGPGADHIEGASGNDELNGGAGDDFVLGGTGDDIVNGNAGDDRVAAWRGFDQVNGGGGNDFLYDAQPSTGGAAFDGGAGNDTVTFGNADGDIAHGGPGDDIFHGGTGDDRAFGEDGDDIMFLHLGDDYGDGGPGDDYLRGGPGNDNLTGQTGNDRISGLDDFRFYQVLHIVDTSNDTDYLFGGPGNDIFHGNENTNPIIDGGGGIDQIPPQPSAGPVPEPEAVAETADFHWEEPILMGVTNTDSTIRFTEDWNFNITNGPAGGTLMSWEVHRADPAGASSDWVWVASGSYAAGQNGTTNFALPGAVTATLDPHGAFLLRVFTADGSTGHFGSYTLNFTTTALKPYDYSNLPPNNLGIGEGPYTPDPAHDPNGGSAIDPISPAINSATDPNGSNPNGPVPIGVTGPDDATRPTCPSNPNLRVETHYWDKVKVLFDRTGGSDQLDDGTGSWFEYQILQSSSNFDGPAAPLPNPVSASGVWPNSPGEPELPYIGDVDRFAEGLPQWAPATLQLHVVDSAGNRTWCDSLSFRYPTSAAFPDAVAPASGEQRCHTLERFANDAQQCRAYLDNEHTESLYHMRETLDDVSDEVEAGICTAAGLIPRIGPVFSGICFLAAIVDSPADRAILDAKNAGYRGQCVAIEYEPIGGDLVQETTVSATTNDYPRCAGFYQPLSDFVWVNKHYCDNNPGQPRPNGSGTC